MEIGSVRLPRMVSRQFAGWLSVLFLSLLVSQSAMDLLFGVFGVFGLIVFVKAWRSGEVRKFFSLGWLDKVILVFAFSVILGLVLSVAPGKVVGFQIGELRWILVLYLLVGVFRAYGAPWPMSWVWRAWWVLVTVSFAEIVIFVVQSEGKVWTHWTHRLEGFHQNSMTHAHLFAVSFLFLGSLLLQEWSAMSARARLLFFGGAFVLGSNLLLSQTRGVWLATSVATCCVAFFSKGWRWGLSVVALVMIVAIGMIATVPMIRERVVMVADYKHSYDLERLTLYRTNWYIFESAPILGVGYNENRRRLREFYDLLGVPPGQFESHAHNQILHLLAGSGMVGALSFLIFIVGSGVSVWREKKNFFRVAMAGALICFLVGGLTEANFEHWKMKYAIVLVLAMGLARWRREPKMGAGHRAL